jgi:23S rRNA (pseudouridine1915-N3)-methyltransferase
LLFIGRPRDRAANELAAEYAKRIGRFCEFRMQEVKSEAALAEHEKAYRVVLDPGGRQMTSVEFAGLLEKGRDLVFLVGGADGVSEEARRKATLTLSLGRMTLPHELARVVVAEQIYRAFAILRGHPYAR